MQRAVADVPAFPEDRLGAVAVVGVEVDHGDGVVPGVAQRLGGDRGVVEVAGAAVPVAGRMVTRRPAERVRRGGAGGDEVHRGQGAVDRRTGGLPGARADQGHRVVAELAGPAVRRGGPGRRHALGHRGRREDIGHDPVLADQLDVRTGQPLGVDGPEVVDEGRGVDAAQHLVVVRRRLHPLVVGQRIQDAVDPLGQLGALGRDADPDLAHRLVAAGLRRPHDGDRHEFSMAEISVRPFSPAWMGPCRAPVTWGS